uniref:Uncharacterized protein n=1 Tax=Knipowitschia caucasica TaxID=637954 RepID=A0AAV2M7U4_KNICA
MAELKWSPCSPAVCHVTSFPTLAEGCKKVLQWLWQRDDLKLELDDMQKELESVRGQKAKTVRDVLTSRCVRWQLLTLAIPCAGVQFCGINAVIIPMKP